MSTARFEPLESRQMMSVALDTNLVVNGDAETVIAPPPPAMPAADSLPEVLHGWDPFGAFELVRYGDKGMPGVASPGPVERGKMLFGGGASLTASNVPDSSGAEQEIDISSIAADVDAGRIKFNFSAYLGGYGLEKDSVKATLWFINPKVEQVPGPIILGPTAAERKGVTGLVPKTLSGDVPIGTRKIRIQLYATKTYGKYIDGFADNIELKLNSSLPLNQGIVTGRVMNDANVNGKLDRGEGGVPDALVFSDRNLNGKWDQGEPSAKTDATGAYAIQTSASLNVMRQVPPAGFHGMGALVRKVIVPAGLTTSGHSFLATRNGVITGNVFKDWNGNGKFDKNDEDEPLELVSVFLDANNNGKLVKGEARTVTDEDGNFSFVVPAGTYTVRQREKVTAYKQSLPGKGRGIVVKLAPGSVSKGNVFGLVPIPQ